MKLAQIVASMREDYLDWNNLKARNQLEDLGVEGTNSEKKVWFGTMVWIQVTGIFRLRHTLSRLFCSGIFVIRDRFPTAFV